MSGWKMWEHGVPDSRITVLYEVDPHYTKGGNKQIQYMCKCVCGKTFVAKGNNLRTGNTKSCGCLHKQLLAERNINQGKEIQIGDRFGKLTVIKDLGMRKQKSRDRNWRWSLCQCDCGSNPIEAPNELLKSGHKKSCGCLGSVGEMEIEKILRENGFSYKKEFIFKDLKSGSGYNYRFDFAVFKGENILFLIEFDGRQHITGPEAFWKNTRTLQEIQKADLEKNEYCKINNILLKRIPYYDIKDITIENILSNKWNL